MGTKLLNEPMLWHHKKFKRSFIGRYERDKWDERIFVLLGYGPKLKLIRIVFESYQAAKALGWYRERRTE